MALGRRRAVIPAHCSFVVGLFDERSLVGGDSSLPPRNGMPSELPPALRCLKLVEAVRHVRARRWLRLPVAAPEGDAVSDVIRFYAVGDEHGCFSNFSSHPVKLKGKIWPTSEHYFIGRPSKRMRLEKVVGLR